jgi:predicted Zn-dependent protease
MPDTPRILYGIGRSYEALAEDSLKRMEGIAPGSAEEFAFSAELELDRGQVAEAFQHFRRALDLKPALRGIRDQIGEIYEVTGHSEWAATERTKEAPEKVGCDERSLECEFAAGHVPEVAAAKADSVETLYWQAKAFLLLSRQALKRLQELPPSVERFQALAIAEEKRGRYPEAAVAWREAVEIKPTDAHLQRQLALALCQSNDCISALPLLEQQLAQEPASAELNYFCGLALNSARNPRQALPYLEKAVQLDGTSLAARAALGEAYLEAGKPDSAIPHLKASLGEDETGSRHYQLARAYQSAGLRDEALAVLRDYRNIIRQRSAEQVTSPAITPP